MSCNHMSVYQLTVERGTKLHKDVKEGKLVSERIVLPFFKLDFCIPVTRLFLTVMKWLTCMKHLFQ